MKINAGLGKTKRLALLVAVVGGTAGMALFAAAPAGAAPIGTQPGNVSLNPVNGAATDTPTWTTTTACPTGFTSTAVMRAYTTAATPVLKGSVSPFVADSVTAPFSGTLLGSMGAIGSTFQLAGTTTEWVVFCSDPVNNLTPVQSTFVTFSADGSTYTSSATPPAGASPTATSLVASPSTAAPGAPVSLTATVSPSAAAGTVEFFDGATSLGTPVAVSGGTASQSVSTLTAGTHSITAHFAPTDSNAFAASTSSASTVTITGGTTSSGTETINVNIPSAQDAGVFALSVSNTPVSLGTAVQSGSTFEATGSLSPVTVSEGRDITKPGWNVSGQVSDFTQGSNVIDGNSLGWTPAITTPNPAADVVVGAAIAAGANPGLKQGGTLAGAATGKGFGTTVLGGGLDLKVPITTNPGAYSATLTITAIDTAS
jgi:hypothetical protein